MINSIRVQSSKPHSDQVVSFIPGFRPMNSISEFRFENRINIECNIHFKTTLNITLLNITAFYLLPTARIPKDKIYNPAEKQERESGGTYQLVV